MKNQYSNQFPIQEKRTDVPINERANIFWRELPEKLPELYKYIMKSGEKEITNEKEN
jgi:hypothetical protein